MGTDAHRPLYRGMRQAEDGKPVVGPSARTLGVRPVDVPIIDGVVRPETGGMSVARDDPVGLPDVRRPAEWGGTGRDPVWQIQQGELGAALSYRDDPLSGHSLHGLIEPNASMTIEEYTRALELTREQWHIVHPEQ